MTLVHAYDRSGNWGTEDVTLPGGLVMHDVLFGDATNNALGSGFMGVRYPFPPSLFLGSLSLMAV
jgi:hypothetical protein